MDTADKKNISGDIAKRFFMAIEMVGYTRYRLAKEVKGVSQQTLTNINAGKNAPSTKVIYAFLEKFPSINGHWIITGKGNPKNSDEAIESASYNRILNKIPVDDIIAYIQGNEATRAFHKSDLYKTFMELQSHRQIMEKIETLEAKVDEVLRDKEENGDKQ